MTGRTLEIRAASVREFFDWSGLLGNNSAQPWSRPHEIHPPLFLREPPGLERRGDVGKYLLLLLSDFLRKEKTNGSESPTSQKRKTNVAKPLETTVSNGGLDRPDRGYVQSRRQVAAAVLSLIMFETGTVRSRN